MSLSSHSPFLSELHDETTFYSAFTQDLLKCRQEVIIESPYLTNERVTNILPVLQKLLIRNVKIYIITRDPQEHSPGLAQQSEQQVRRFEEIGIHTLLCSGNHHRKLAMLDRKVLWEGSLNILSQTRSREIMRRIDSQEICQQTFDFLKFGRYLSD